MTNKPCINCGNPIKNKQKNYCKIVCDTCLKMLEKMDKLMKSSPTIVIK